MSNNLNTTNFEIGIIYEHPQWHIPLFEELDRRCIPYVKMDLTKGAFWENKLPEAKLYYNLVSPSANLRGNQKAIPYARAICRNLEYSGHTVINGYQSMELEMSKSAQIFLLSSLEIDHPRSIIFNDIDSLDAITSELSFPLVLKPEQGGSGSRMYLIYSLDELKTLLQSQPELWLPDQMLVLQEYLRYDSEFGIVRLEFLGDNLLYAMRIVTHGTFNLCPSVVCNPEDGESSCSVEPNNAKPEFFPYLEVPLDAVETGKKIMKAAGHRIGSVEYVDTIDCRRVFYDINANSNLRATIGESFGIEPFSEVANYLTLQGHL